ncbi:MAG: DUF3332 family protein [Desulfuromonadaceae bacterium]|nr:DUF3332 family protein [Desulfuromonadaceae bacterium]MDD2855687.1 DUF3332 family protein [Desulfuromonadaceae bacterium]
MKKSICSIMISLLLATTLLGCYGNFVLTKKVYQFNGEVKNKFIRSGVTWAFLIIPVYKIAALADFVVLNTIQFWSGSNPIAEGEKTFEYVDGADRFNIRTQKSGDNVTCYITHYNFDRYIDTLQIELDKNSNSAKSLYRSGSDVVENFLSDDGNRVTVQTREPGYFPVTLTAMSNQ